MPATSNHCDQALLSSRCSSGVFTRSDGLARRLCPDINLGLQTGKSCSEQRRTASSPLQLPSPCLTATSTSSRTKSIWCIVAETRKSMREHLNVVRDALDRIAAGTLQNSGILTVSTSPDFAAKWLLYRLGRFAEAHPGRPASVITSR